MMQRFHYSIEELYMLFSVLSAVVLFVLLKVKERSFDNVGMSFLLSTSIKMVVCYLILRPVLQASGENSGIEKKNFLDVYSLFSNRNHTYYSNIKQKSINKDF